MNKYIPCFSDSSVKCIVVTPSPIKVTNEFDVAFENALSNPNLIANLKSMAEGCTAMILVDTASGNICPKAVFDAIEGTNKTIILNQNGFQWIFHGDDILEQTKDINLTITTALIDGAEFGLSNNVFKIDFYPNGLLPGIANVRIKSDYIYQIYNLSGAMNLYYLGNNDVLEQELGTVDYILDGTDHWCKFDISHNSTFLLSAAATKNDPTVTYNCHIQDIGWQGSVIDGAISGTSGESRRLEAIHIELAKIDGGVQYRTHVQDIGWMDWEADGALSGTSGQSKRLEAIQIRLTGAAADLYDIYYCVHAQNYGWLDWAKNGESSGTAGYGYRLEAIRILLVEKGGAAPGSVTKPFVDMYSQPLVSYQTHVQDIGWQGYVSNGEISGTSGQSKRLEAIQIKLQNLDGGIEYSTHVQDYGWMALSANDAPSGTSGESKRLEAIRIRLTGAAADLYDIYYCVHAQNTGWLDWAKNGASSGTAGFGYRLEAIKIVLVPKGGSAPGSTERPYIEASL